MRAFGALVVVSAWSGVSSTTCTGGEVGGKYWFKSDTCTNPDGDSTLAPYFASATTCVSFGSCVVGGASTPDTQEADCDVAGGAVWTAYALTTETDCADATKDAVTGNLDCECNHNTNNLAVENRATRFDTDATGRSCWALEGPPRSVRDWPCLLAFFLCEPVPCGRPLQSLVHVVR